jgi:ABC-type lipoprotein export system ATPase subunit
MTDDALPTDRSGRASAAPALVELEQIEFRYPGRDGGAAIVVLDGISLAVRPRALVCVAGRSGSGKSTLLMVAAGLLLPSAGRVRWQGERVEGASEAVRARRRRSLIGFVFQNAGLIASLTAAENVALPGPPEGRSGDGRTRSVAVLERVGLTGRDRHFPSQLSGGEQQRVAVARALYAEPPLLIVDEPTANLDRATADTIIDLLADLALPERGLLVATHDQRLIERADVVLYLE